MSLQIAAQHLAAQGRGPDTTLVHMTPDEVKSLQSIAMAHGGSLTINPQTGLPEAGFLSTILPMVAGVALGPAGIGLTAMQAGLAAGALTGLATGSLRKGLMAGLGAYGGAGIGDVIGKAGTGAMSQAAGAGVAVPEAVAPTFSPVSDPSVLGYDPAAFGTAGPHSPEVSRLLNTYPASVAPAAPTLPTVDTSGIPQPMSQAGADAFRMHDLETAQQRAVMDKLATTTPTETFTKGIGAIADKPSLLFNKDNMKYGAAALGSMMFQEPKSVQAPRDTEQYRYAYNPGRELPPSRIGDVGEYTYFRPSYTRLAADGGLMGAMPVQQMSDRNDAQMMMANGGQMYAKGGISHLGDYSDGGRLLRGPGDGVSDSIPATIANKRPARLADGEFVVPARIVSELGNGSTDAGARKLYAMMDRVQKNRGKTVGKGKVAVNSRSEKLLPA